MLLSNYVSFIFFLFIRTFCLYVLIGLLFLIADNCRKMVGGGLQQSVAELYGRVMPHSDAGEGFERSTGFRRGRGRGKGGPKSRGKGGGRRRRAPSPIALSGQEEEADLEEEPLQQEQH